MAADKLLLRGKVIHVNEDGWVVINLGAREGVQEGQRFAVLGERRPRQIHDPFAPGAPKPSSQPVLRVDTAYELLRVILVERACCVAVSTRVPPERTPQPFLGPQGELLLYTPAPADWRYDAFELEEAAEEDEAEEGDTNDEQAEESGVLLADEGDQGEHAIDVPEDAEEAPFEEDPAELMARQQEHLWDGSLPLNAVQVGDEVILAQPYSPAGLALLQAMQGSAAETGAPLPSLSPSGDLTPPATYEWMKPS
ncbi:MAG TPA: hypothetical protein VH540_19095 [Ktedonobacterales bacterium]|jgi:hypothetical protein